MEQINAKVKRWGNSLGIILPREVVTKEKLDEGTEIEILVVPKHATKVKDVFGILKGKLHRPTKEVLAEVDRDFEPKE